MTVYNIKEFGAVPGRDATDAIQRAIDSCEEHGGGTVYIPAGIYETGPIELKSNITLYLENGARLSFSEDFERYPVVETRWSGYVCHGFMPLIYANRVTNVSIKGDGVIDGNGRAWWDINSRLRQGESYQSPRTKEIAEANADFTEPADTNLVEWPSQFLRPPLIQFFRSEHIRISEVTVCNSPFWNTHLVFCNNVSIQQVHFQNPSDTPNGDGLDIDSCQNVRIADCHFDVGDDCVVLKSGINEDGRKYHVPTKNVTVTNCTMHHGHGGVVLGSENSGGIENVTVANCVFDGTDRGIRIKTNRERGSYIRNLLVQNIMMDDVLCPIAINSFYRHGVSKSNPELLDAAPVEVSEKTPVVEHIKINNIIAKNCRAAAAFIYGLPEMPVKHVSLEHVTLEMTQDESIPGGEPDMVREVIDMAGEGMFAKYVENLTLHHVQVQPRSGPALRLSHANDVNIEALSFVQQEEQETSVILYEETNRLNVKDIEEGQNFIQKVGVTK
ncbi:glycoside hydrolase family 28 protein [Gracilibacillus caseinilyticus]|uniref:Glycoside hydrolase family 28 protein n=1 Tax=Gracilibacillus caseinilyticus TaxID=2932256 RepID=A0ABY4F1K1_9BACI|nr:glycoside hydrolase family 28 protein [Gracilibacillus caseinilyticus]UOQ50037.1 glycoside hydrolase family 28 protein [Gracilibacillus caseinilyticus]